MIFHVKPLAFLMVVVALAVGGCKQASPRSGDRISAPSAEKEPDALPGHSRKIASAHAHYAAGVLLEQNGDLEAAFKEFRLAVQEDPDDDTPALEVSLAYLRARQPEKALELLQIAAARPSASGEVFARLGLVLGQLGRNDEALTASKMAVKKSPDELGGYQNLFYHYLKNKTPDEALKVLDEASRRQKVDAEFLIGLGDLYRNFALQFPTQREEIHKRGTAALSRAEAQSPKSPQTRLRLADGFYAMGRSDRAAQHYLELLDKVEDSPMILEAIRSRLADIYLRGNDSKLAREQLEAIVRTDPANAQAYYFLGSIAYDEKNWTNAVEQLKKAVVLRPNFEQAYYDLAAAQLAADRAEDASETLRQVKKSFSTKFITEYLMAMSSQHLKNYADAVTHFTAAEVLANASDGKPLTANFYFQSGIAHERTGDREQAAKFFQKALDLQPDFPEAQNYLGYMWAEKGENLDRAKELIEKALKSEPKSAAYLDSMGWVLFKQNQPQAALEYLLKAVELTEEPDATLYDHLGDIYAALNQADKAREAWQKSIGVEKNDEVKKKLDAVAAP
jgi:tetratricopeptide (TPR) repeat protein